MKLSQVVVVVAAVLVGVPAASFAQAPKASPTFSKDIVPIFQERCQVCHRPDGMAPMSLVSYNDVRPWARSIKTRVTNHEMPPWAIDRTVGIQEFANDRSITEQQIKTIADWVDAGAPAGDPKDAPAAKQWPSGDVWQLEDYFKRPPDLVVKSGTYMMPAVSMDQWWQPMSDYVFPEDVWVAGTETRAAARSRKVVHHAGTHLYQDEDPEFVKIRSGLLGGKAMDASVAAPEKTRPTDSIDPKTLVAPEPGGQYFSEWAIGKAGEIFEETNSGQFIRKGARFGWDMHLYATGEETPAQLEVALWFYPKGVTPKYRAFKSAFSAAARGNTEGTSLNIPPNQLAMHEGYTILGAPAIVVNYQPHMHLRGKAMTMEVIYPDGHVEMLNSVSNFDFRWMTNYIYTAESAPVLPRGAIIKVTAWHDNTTANKSNPDPKQYVTLGDRSVDEMAHSNQVVIFISDEDYDKIIKERAAKKAAATNNQQ